MSTYLPPSGDGLALPFGGTYTPPSGDGLAIPFGGGEYGVAAGTSTVTGHALAGAIGVGSSVGTSTCAAVGRSTAKAVGSCAGVSTCSGIGASGIAAIGTAAGVASSSFVGSFTQQGTATSTGTSTVTGHGAFTLSIVGVAAGTSTVDGVGALLWAAKGTAAGLADVIGIGTSFKSNVVKVDEVRVVQELRRIARLRDGSTRVIEELNYKTGCTKLAQQAVAGIAVAGCATAGVDHGQRPANVQRRRMESLSRPKRVIETVADEYTRTHPLQQGCTSETRKAIAGIGKSGCAVAGLDVASSAQFPINNSTIRRTIETLRSPTSRVLEATQDQFSRLHPIVQGCSKTTRQAVAGIAAAGCALAGFDSGYR